MDETGLAGIASSITAAWSIILRTVFVFLRRLRVFRDLIRRSRCPAVASRKRMLPMTGSMTTLAQV